jgi:hypothetical protein
MPTIEELASVKAGIPLNLVKILQVPAPTRAMLEYLRAMGEGAKMIAAFAARSPRLIPTGATAHVTISDDTIRRLFK